MKVTQQTVGVKRVASDGHGDFPIVPVHWLAHTRHNNGVRGGECAANSKFKHKIEYMVLA